MCCCDGRRRQVEREGGSLFIIIIYLHIYLLIHLFIIYWGPLVENREKKCQEKKEGKEVEEGRKVP